MSTATVPKQTITAIQCLDGKILLPALTLQQYQDLAGGLVVLNQRRQTARNKYLKQDVEAGLVREKARFAKSLDFELALSQPQLNVQKLA